jgi:hypothetical protein
MSAACVARVESSFVEQGEALLEIRRDKLYREQGTFEEFCLKQFDMTIRHADRLMRAVEAVANLKSGPMGPLPQTERQTRPLTDPKLSPETMRAAWENAVASAPNGKPTAKHVAAAVDEVLNRSKPLADQSSFLEDEEEDEEKPESAPEPNPTLKSRERWQKFWEDLSRFLVSMPRVGGIVEFTKDWPRIEREAALANLQEMEKLSRQCVLELQEAIRGKPADRSARRDRHAGA